MSIDTAGTVTNVQGGITSNNSAAQSSGTSTNDKDMFLKLLVTQMQYQDPMNPVDSTQMLTQTAQFDMVEKLDDLATSTASLLSAQSMLGATSMIGKSVTYLATDGSTTTGTVTSASFGSNGTMLKVKGANGTDPVDVPIAMVQQVAAPSA
jgi:flagellar basal-body rod modification protein FlgD